MTTKSNNVLQFPTSDNKPPQQGKDLYFRLDFVLLAASKAACVDEDLPLYDKLIGLATGEIEGGCFVLIPADLVDVVDSVAYFDTMSQMNDVEEFHQGETTSV